MGRWRFDKARSACLLPRAASRKVEVPKAARVRVARGRCRPLNVVSDCWAAGSSASLRYTAAPVRSASNFRHLAMSPVLAAQVSRSSIPDGFRSVVLDPFSLIFWGRSPRRDRRADIIGAVPKTPWESRGIGVLKVAELRVSDAAVPMVLNRSRAGCLGNGLQKVPCLAPAMTMRTVKITAAMPKPRVLLRL